MKPGAPEETAQTEPLRDRGIAAALRQIPPERLAVDFAVRLEMLAYKQARAQRSSSSVEWAIAVFAGVSFALAAWLMNRINPDAIAQAHAFWVGGVLASGAAVGESQPGVVSGLPQGMAAALLAFLIWAAPQLLRARTKSS